MQSPLQFQLGDIVFARCRDSPFWPAKVIQILQEHRIYKVSFFNHNTSAYIDENDLLLFTNDTIKSQKKSLINKMRQCKVQNRTRNVIFKGIEMAEKEKMPHRQLIKQQSPVLQQERIQKEETEQSEQKKNLLSKEKQLTIELSFEAMNKRKRSPTHFIDPHPSKKQKLSEEQSIVPYVPQSLSKEQKQQNYNMEHIQYQIQKKFSRLKKKEKELKRLQKKNRQDMEYLRKSSSQHIDSQIHEMEQRQYKEKDNLTINPGKQEIVLIEEMIPPSYVERQAEEVKEISLVHLQQRPKIQQKSQEVLLEEVSQQSEVFLPVFIEPNVQVLVDIKEQSPHEIAQVQEIIRYKQETPEVAVITKTEIADGSCQEISRPERQVVPEYYIKQPFQQLPVVEEKEQSQQQYIKKETVNHVEIVQKHEEMPVNKIEQQVLLEYEESRQVDQGNEQLHVQMKKQSEDAGSSQQENHIPSSSNQPQNKESSQSHFEPHSLVAQNGSKEAENDQAEEKEDLPQSERSIPIQERADSQGKHSSYQEIEERIPIARMKEQEPSQEQQEGQQQNFPSQQFSQGQDQAINSNAPATIDRQMDVQSNGQAEPQPEHQQIEREECESFQNPLYEVIHKKLEREMDATGLEVMFNQEFGIPDDYAAIMGNLHKAHLSLQQLPRSLIVQSLRTYSLQMVHYLDGKCDLRENLLTMTQRQLFLAIITMDNLDICSLYETGIIDELTYLINLFETSPKKTRTGKYHAEYLMTKARMNYYQFQLANPVKLAENQSFVPSIQGQA